MIAAVTGHKWHFYPVWVTTYVLGDCNFHLWRHLKALPCTWSLVGQLLDCRYQPILSSFYRIDDQEQSFTVMCISSLILTQIIVWLKIGVFLRIRMKCSFSWQYFSWKLHFQKNPRLGSERMRQARTPDFFSFRSCLKMTKNQFIKNHTLLDQVQWSIQQDSNSQPLDSNLCALPLCHTIATSMSRSFATMLLRQSLSVSRRNKVLGASNLL